MFAARNFIIEAHNYAKLEYYNSRFFPGYILFCTEQISALPLDVWLTNINNTILNSVKPPNMTLKIFQIPPVTTVPMEITLMELV
jgi:hypothetical protein